jgi:hypothetical protein
MGFEKLEGRGRIAMRQDCRIRGAVEHCGTEEDALQCVLTIERGKRVRVARRKGTQLQYAQTTGKVEIKVG